MMFRNARFLCRKFSGSAKLMQQQFATRPPAGYRPFGQQQSAEPVAEEASGEDFSDAPSATSSSRFGSFAPRQGAPRLASAPSADFSKPAINPFPEELSKDYSSPSLFSGASEAPFSKEVLDVLHAELTPEEVEIKPDGAIYLPENRYRRILCKAFGSGGWCLVPRGAHSLSSNVLSREYALFCGGRFVSQARGHSTIQAFSNPAMASEAVRSNALMRVCKDLGIGNELWDPAFSANWKATYAVRRNENGKLRWAKAEQSHPQ